MEFADGESLFPFKSGGEREVAALTGVGICTSAQVGDAAADQGEYGGV